MTKKIVKRENVDKVFLEEIKNMTDKQFWKWVESWYDQQIIIDEALNWEQGLVEDQLTEWGYEIIK